MGKKSFKKGFTLVELLIVISIIIFSASISFDRYLTGEKQLKLERSANKLVQDIRRTQNMALASRAIGEQPISGYGIYFELDKPDQYIIFANTDSDYLRGPEDIDLEVISLDEKINIFSLAPPVDSLNIVFYPIEPKVIINNDDSKKEAEITLSYLQASFKIIKVNKAGLIEVR